MSKRTGRPLKKVTRSEELKVRITPEEKEYLFELAYSTTDSGSVSDLVREVLFSTMPKKVGSEADEE